MSTDLHGIRRTRNLGIETPLLVPSFSSRGFPGLAEMIEAVRADVSNLCLVSAYDVANGHCPAEFETLANVLVLDSGVYECGRTPVAVDSFLPPPSGNAWSRDAHRQFLSGVAARLSSTNVIVVSYDTFAPLRTQVAAALEDFRSVRDAATDFLLKPETEGAFHGQYSFQGSNVGAFDVIGVTERELGSSAMTRCCAIVRLRAALTTAGLDIPIHVFGSITPAAVTAYFMCGADIFDGLNWLRVSLDRAWAGAASEFAVAHGYGTLDDREVQLQLWRQNLRTLRRTQAALRRFATNANAEMLVNELPFAKASVELAHDAIAAGGV